MAYNEDQLEPLMDGPLEDILQKLERHYLIPEDPKKNPPILMDDQELRDIEQAIYWKLTGVDFVYKAPCYLSDFEEAQKVIPAGWHLAELWQSVVPADRPWWGCGLRQDEPYRYYKVKACRDPYAAVVINSLRMRIKYP